MPDPVAAPTGASAVLPVVAVVGPTATGKSELALDLAERLGGEIVSADASQLYRGMDIGTAKVPLDRRRGIPHHQLDLLEVTEEASVAAYQREARTDVGRIRAAGKLPVVVGGSGLYVRAVLDRLQIPPTDADLRRGLEEQLATDGVDALFSRLAALDPSAAAAIGARNGRRIVRALEVVQLTGQPFPATMPSREYVAPTVTLGLELPRDRLDERIGARVVRMWADGLLAEVAGLLDRGLRAGRTASRALGYAQAVAQLDGVLDRDQAVAATTAATRRFARRQQSWFRADPRVRWLRADDPDLLATALALVAAGDNGRDG
ncbi:MAG TPA: tRNA (adenosine(37)-N6)-dimethylallyltransferase MiaA [Dermatophilaceae bacterium]|nr:tRNA (adenosine(37)-N6)-dimethylallyltransferase MiaA [Dermatophilaceae bacterium]